MSVTWVRLALDLDGSTLVPAEPPPGITLTSLQELGDSEAHRQLVYDLNKVCSADIPERGEFFSLEEYLSLRFDAPGMRPDGMVLAFDHHRAVGLCQLTCPPGRQWALIEMTGVLPAYRRHGLATAMKVRGLGAAKSWGCSEVRTFHHPSNAAVIAANRSLGFHNADFAP